ncbi:nitroreductase family deazaflavin-dependent oxidoreductase [Actinoplanes sp. KI2]|uniref:nitroreductase family deazaflavin-dependent oxidoreductase n=1 Tax=Actinoplanes sp. KI2 TaxID=2983315 RepID=UPI0021D61522|nr:nitroreductase family deazaflavin-dependent oxidoreductase [Actinoplanes sp. KI2]MCU7727481.1 nitroreductase family deazaflavin-dependent oxidoreductase [Actinoplanes sp. KI2]
MWKKTWRAVGAWPGFTPVARSLVGLDRWLGRLTRGRVVALGMAPSLMLTTTGRRSGQPRSNPLQYVRDGDDLIVIASNWGGTNDPGWAWNLRSDANARVLLGGRDLPVKAHETHGADRDRLWQLIVDQWPGYQNYRTRASHRRLPIFRLTPTP